jgi:hypothetical protein
LYEHQDWGSFRFQLNLNMNENLKIFMIKFPKFDNLYATLLLQKKGKNVEIQKEHKKTNRIFFNPMLFRESIQIKVTKEIQRLNSSSPLFDINVSKKQIQDLDFYFYLKHIALFVSFCFCYQFSLF